MDFTFLKTKAFLFGCAVVLILWAGYCAWLWQPKRQVALHHRHFLDAIEQRQWKALSEFLADDFQDGHGHDKVWVLKESREMLRHFFVFLAIEESETTVLLKPSGGGEVRALLRIDGRGSAFVDEIIRRVNASHERFEFHWRKASWKPWDWQLTQVAHPLLGEMP